MSYHPCGNHVESLLPSMSRMFPFCIRVSSCAPRPRSCQSQPRWRHLATRRRWKSCTPYMKTCAVGRPPSGAASPNFCRLETSCSQTWREAKLALDWTWSDAARGPCESHTQGRLPSLENAEIPRGVSSSPRSHLQNHRCVHGRVDAEPFAQPVGGVCTLLSQGGAHLL